MTGKRSRRQLGALNLPKALVKRCGRGNLVKLTALKDSRAITEINGVREYRSRKRLKKNKEIENNE